MANYTLSYSVPVVNVNSAALQGAWSAIPTDADLASELGLTLTSDTITLTGSTMTRTIVYASTGSGPLGDPDTAAALENVYTETFSLGLSTRVVAAPVAVS